jgi:phage terminase Nu1 subunit (DNA packaging protein)
MRGKAKELIMYEKPVLLCQDDVASILSVSTRTMEDWRLRGGGPPYVVLSRRCVRYDLAVLIDWIRSRAAQNTSQSIG